MSSLRDEAKMAAAMMSRSLEISKTNGAVEVAVPSRVIC